MLVAKNFDLHPPPPVVSFVGQGKVQCRALGGDKATERPTAVYILTRPPTFFSTNPTLADMELLKNVIKDSNHILYDLLPPKNMHGYNLTTRPHQHVLRTKNVYPNKNFLDRMLIMLYVDMY